MAATPRLLIRCKGVMEGAANKDIAPLFHFKNAMMATKQTLLHYRLLSAQSASIFDSKENTPALNP